ncbi:hypothetical protein CFOL_v3_05197, partial [Cephalotus follicularis]
PLLPHSQPICIYLPSVDCSLPLCQHRSTYCPTPTTLPLYQYLTYIRRFPPKSSSPLSIALSFPPLSITHSLSLSLSLSLSISLSPSLSSTLSHHSLSSLQAPQTVVPTPSSRLTNGDSNLQVLISGWFWGYGNGHFCFWVGGLYRGYMFAGC